MATSRREVAIPGWDTLQWRQIVVQGPQQTSETGVKLSQEHPTRCGGGFCYKEGSHMSSVTRNRFLIWLAKHLLLFIYLFIYIFI